MLADSILYGCMGWAGPCSQGLEAGSRLYMFWLGPTIYKKAEWIKMLQVPAWTLHPDMSLFSYQVGKIETMTKYRSSILKLEIETRDTRTLENWMTSPTQKDPSHYSGPISTEVRVINPLTMFIYFQSIWKTQWQKGRKRNLPPSGSFRKNPQQLRVG